MGRNSLSGYLVVADISGYTSYLASTELEHSQEVLAEILELIISRFRPLLTVVRLEGDAVFAHAPEGQISRGESLAELLEVTYTAFRDYVRGVIQRTTCQCDACRSIPSLDLKFIVHYGDYVIQEVSGIKELAGTEVNRLFRLGKNHVTAETGWNAYILYTEAALDKSGISGDAMPRLVESYQHLGEVAVRVLDLHQRYHEISEARHVVLEPEDAHGVLVFDFDLPAAVVWEWLNDPLRRSQVSPHTRWSAFSRSGGRTGVGAVNHCAHGKDGLTCETILDWRPFEYVTSLKTNGKLPGKLFDMEETVSFEPIKEGAATRVEFRQKLAHVPRFLARPMLGSFFKAFTSSYLQPLAQMMREEFRQTYHEDVAPAQSAASSTEAV